MFLDTSGMLCLLHQAELLHHEACQAYKTAPFKITQNYVLAEFVALAHVRRLARKNTLTFMTDLLDNPDIHVVWVDELLHREALTLLQSRLDKTYSLCDAVSFAIMRQRNVVEALTTDRHFEQEGFRRLLV